MYGTIAEAHLKTPHNLGKLADADGIGTVEAPESDTLVTVYVKLSVHPDGRRAIGEARFRAFGCGACIITSSVATELATGRLLADASMLDASAILAAIDNGLPEDQRYCAELAARALRLACIDAAR